MMAADYRHIGSLENRLGRHYSRFLAFWPAPALAGQSLALRKLCDAGSNRRSRVKHVADHPETPAMVLLSAHGGGRDGVLRTSRAGMLAGDRLDEITARARALVAA